VILRWILDNLPAGGTVLIRLRDEEGDAFELRIRKYRGCIYAQEIRQCRNAKRLYLWRKEVTYNDLTIKEIEESVRRAEEKDRRKQRRKTQGGKTIPNAERSSSPRLMIIASLLTN